MKTTALIAFCVSLVAAPCFAADVTCAYNALTAEQLARAHAMTKEQINGVPGSTAKAKEMADMAETATAACPAEVRNSDEMVSRAASYIIGKLFVTAIDQTLEESAPGVGTIERLWSAMPADDQKRAVSMANSSGEMSVEFIDLTVPVLFNSMPTSDTRLMAMAGMGLFFRALQTAAVGEDRPIFTLPSA